MSDGVLEPAERLTLGALRYAVNEEAGTYLAIMRLFTAGISGFLSDQSSDEITDRLRELGIELDRDTVDQRLSYLVEHGNLARSPRETEARSVREYLSNRSRYQLTPRGELVQRHVEELLARSDGAREVSSEMLPGMLAGLTGLGQLCEQGLDRADPTDLATRISTLFAQFEVLVTSTRQFYSYLAQVLNRFDLGRDEFVLFKSALIDYLQRFVDEISRHLPQMADQLARLEPHVPQLCGRADSTGRLVALDGSQARRAPGLEPDDWKSLHAWFIGSPGRRADADNVRRLATDALRALLTNLRRIAAGADRHQSRYGDLVRLARWFDDAPDGRGHELWAATFGLYGGRHLSFAAETEGDPVPSTRSWWDAPAAEVPVGLRLRGERQAGGRAAARVDYTAAKQARLAERAGQEVRLRAAAAELATQAGRVSELRVSDEARSAFLDLYAAALTRAGRPLGPEESAQAVLRTSRTSLSLDVRREPGASLRLRSPAGTLVLRDLAIELGTVEPAEGLARRAEA
ncbi:TIGR02677 family protein [Ornithinimicrobium cerasi]|uniref:TIGR02677 family protein n=1 Tax=Ornithinimicrobium cerasi TaxID=2248773 RepID=A0A285VHP5_9MICO|nr:TIGR02677 family protein [Ornithinimicrobium cerasi]SOC53605.1 TIGR02677 family protein [Ornithinimicrobium cerasi]